MTTMATHLVSLLIYPLSPLSAPSTTPLPFPSHTTPFLYYPLSPLPLSPLPLLFYPSHPSPLQPPSSFRGEWTGHTWLEHRSPTRARTRARARARGVGDPPRSWLIIDTPLLTYPYLIYRFRPYLHTVTNIHTSSPPSCCHR